MSTVMNDFNKVVSITYDQISKYYVFNSKKVLKQKNSDAKLSNTITPHMPIPKGHNMIK